MRKIQALLLCFALLVTGLAFAQTRQVKGVVTDSAGAPLPNVSVQVQNTRVGTRTNETGTFVIDLPPGSNTLLLTSIGFEPQQVNVAGKDDVSVTLNTARQNAMQEVVVTAMGITRTQKSLGYSTTNLKGDELIKARESNVVNSLAGKVAGVRVTSQSGTPGGSSKIILRGQSSFSDPSGGQPIFVIDGLPIDNSSQQLATTPSAVPQGSAGVDFGNRAGDINPDDIESVNVLKGAAATALYGARAKNGAIIITTKRGKRGASVVRFNSSVRFDKPLRLPDYQNEYAQGNYGVYSINSTNGWGPKISEVQDRTFPNFLGQQVKLQAYPDNVKDFYKTGNTYINSISFEGGGESGDFRLGYTNYYQTGIVEKESFGRNSINLNAGRAVSAKFDVRTTLNYVSSIGKNRPIQSSNNSNSLVQIVQFLPRTVDSRALKANYVDPVTGQQITLTPTRTGNNPYWVIYNNTSENNVERIYGNAVLSYKPISWLTISNNFGSDVYNEFRKLVTRPGTAGQLQGNFFQANLFNRILNNDFIITADKRVTNDLNIRALAGLNNYEAYYRRDQADAQQLTVDELYTFSNAATVTNSNTSNKRRIIGVFGEVGLSYKNYLYLNATGRNDWSSTLPVENRSYFYPSVSTSFVFTELWKPKPLSYGKIRASWANVGSDTDPYQLAFNYTAVSQVFAQYGQGSQFPFGGLLGFTIPPTIPNAQLKPQNQQSYEAGIDLRFLKDRARIDFTYYNTKTADQIIALALPQSTGFATKRVNAGAIKNEGIELTLSGRPLMLKSFNWDIDVNFTKNRQTVEDLPADIKQYTLASAYNGLQIRARNGEQIGMWGTGFERDPSGNIVINPNNGLRRVVTDQRFGNVFPDWTMGINNSFSYKGLNLSFLFDFRQGGVFYSGTVGTLRSLGLAKETAIDRDKIIIDKGVLLDAATGKYVPNTVPVQSMQDFWGQFGNNTASEPAVFDASYIKLREAVLNYSFPAKWFTNQAFVKGLSLGVEGRNLWLIKSNVPHIDPEVNLFGSASVGEGVEFYNLPSTRSFGINLRATF
ncbi:SusC/RagA family TonB-linked outer membrane protein [Flavisolibacter nicotianae]|uniref:SusC/RagA family TonB-linked outer membrane protein n=1 Tax=Flavisolibacter nicotianae TaxID=2364882 RepID=UPI000EB0C6B1|nr:SusC/RagA family TonB-linked outer membrane protein [Flavisolibacter nicotianae]